jgi:uncharacterized protein (DUF1697 family)
MPIYIAMLRGINVSGYKIIPMLRLRESFEALGYKGVKTYIQSGNIIFDAGRDSSVSAAKRIEAKILSVFGHAVPVIVRTERELAGIIAANPFLKQKAIDPTKLHVTFLEKAPIADGVKKLESRDAGSDRFHVVGREAYLYCLNGYGVTKLSNTAIEKAFSIRATTRNWKTVNKLAELASA